MSEDKTQSNSKPSSNQPVTQSQDLVSRVFKKSESSERVADVTPQEIVNNSPLNPQQPSSSDTNSSGTQENGQQ